VLFIEATPEKTTCSEASMAEAVPLRSTEDGATAAVGWDGVEAEQPARISSAAAPQ
jgi:hypothetical protein